MAIAGASVIAALMSASAQGAPVNLAKQSEGWVYFNRPGADMTATEAQMAACAVAVHGWRPGGASAAAQGLLVNLIGAGMQGEMLAASLEHCMVLRGWRVVRVPDAEGAALAALAPEALADKLKDWVGAGEPHGTVVRAWSNDAAKAETVVHVFMPGMTSRQPLNARAISPAKTTEIKFPNAPSPFDRSPKSVIKAVTPAQLAAAAPGSAIIIFTLSNSAPTDWTRVGLTRLGPSFEVPAYKDGGGDVIFTVIPDRPKGGPKGAPVSQTWGFVVPPGRWAISTISDMVTLCLGAPFTDVAAGEVVDLGTLEFGRDGRPIDQNPATAKAFLEGQPQLAGRLRSAKWVNGATFPCLNYAAAMEYPDAPYAPGYVRGGTPSLTAPQSR